MWVVPGWVVPKHRTVDVLEKPASHMAGPAEVCKPIGAGDIRVSKANPENTGFYKKKANVFNKYCRLVYYVIV